MGVTLELLSVAQNSLMLALSSGFASKPLGLAHGLQRLWCAAGDAVGRAVSGVREAPGQSGRCVKGASARPPWPGGQAGLDTAPPRRGQLVVFHAYTGGLRGGCVCGGANSVVNRQSSAEEEEVLPSARGRALQCSGTALAWQGLPRSPCREDGGAGGVCSVTLEKQN